jgi:hypothetical protein
MIFESSLLSADKAVLSKLAYTRRIKAVRRSTMEKLKISTNEHGRNDFTLPRLGESCPEKDVMQIFASLDTDSNGNGDIISHVLPSNMQPRFIQNLSHQASSDSALVCSPELRLCGSKVAFEAHAHSEDFCCVQSRVPFVSLGESVNGVQYTEVTIISMSPHDQEVTVGLSKGNVLKMKLGIGRNPRTIGLSSDGFLYSGTPASGRRYASRYG